MKFIPIQSVTVVFHRLCTYSLYNLGNNVDNFHFGRDFSQNVYKQATLQKLSTIYTQLIVYLNIHKYQVVSNCRRVLILISTAPTTTTKFNIRKVLV